MNFVHKVGWRCGAVAIFEHVMIALMWPAQHFQLRIILLGAALEVRYDQKCDQKLARGLWEVLREPRNL